MADRHWARDRAGLGRGMVDDGGFADVNGASGVTTSRHPLGTIARTGVGTFALTLNDRFVRVQDVQVTLQTAALTAIVAQVASVVEGSAGTNVINFRTFNPTSGAAAELTGRVYVRALVKNTGVEP